MISISRILLLTACVGAACAMLACQSSAGTGGGDGGSDSDGDTDGDADCGWEVMVEPGSELFGMLRDVWGSGPNDVYAVASGDSFVHYDGTSWHKVEIPTPSEEEGAFDFFAVWGSSPTDVFAVGYQDELGLVIHYDGTEWLKMEIPEATPLAGVWGNSSSDVYAVGPGIEYSWWFTTVSVLHYDGETWNETGFPEATNQQLRLVDVWGSGPNDVFFTATDADFLSQTSVWHFDGSDWSKMLTSQYWRWTSRFSGLSSDDVVLMMIDDETDDCLAHWDGDVWSQYGDCDGATEGDESLVPCDWVVGIVDLWRPAPSTLYVVDGGRNVWLRDGEQWSLELLTDPDPDDDVHIKARAIWGSSETDIFVVGSAIWHYGCK
jgi:hypothetical protein